MASRKRSRALDDVDGEVEIESASSSLRQSLSKRSRVALAQENGGSVVSDDEEEEAGDYVDGASQHGPTGSYSDAEDEDDGIGELQATQIVQKQIREHRDNIASDEGVIEEVFCRNFMCHSKLRIKLGPLINFIIGHNGSGKSAVLTALTMCLGGKATTTNRGASLKSLIKEGEESATLAVKIKNQGESAYKPELYGRSILVERNFSRSGTSGFKLKNDEDKVVSTRKADLDDILDYFAFQLDNPINVLTQDMARAFLSNSTPSDKYKFFIRGTQLEALDRDYQVIEEHLDSVERQLENRQDDVEILKRKMDEAEQKKKRSEQTQRMQDKITELGMQHAWAQVQEQEEVLEKNNTEVQDAEQQLDLKRHQAESDSAEYDTENQASEEADQARDALKTEQTPLQEKRDAEKDKFDTNKKALGEVLAQQRLMKDTMRQQTERIEKLKSDIQEEQGRLAGAEGAEHAERMAEMERLQAIVQEVKRAEEEHGDGLAALEAEKAEAAKAVDSARPTLVEKRDNVSRAEGQLNRARSAQPRPWEGYRQGMEQLVRIINNETRWRTKPVGPMGKHVTLLQAKWSSQIESTFGGALDAFVVTCKEDSVILSEHMRRVRCTPSVFIGDATPLDTTGKEPEEGIDTTLRVLQIDNDLVRNQLIINHAIDQTVLIANLAQAREYISGTRDAPHPPPRNVKASICITDGKYGTRFDCTRAGNMRAGDVRPWENPRMKYNQEDRIQTYQQDLERAKRERDAAEHTHRELQKAANQAAQAVVRFNRRQSELKVDVQRAEDAVDGQQAEIDNNRPQDGKLQELERQLAEAKGDLESEERSYEDSVVSRDDFNAKSRELKGVLDTAQAELNGIGDRIKRAEKQAERAGRARQDALHKKNLSFKLIDTAQKELDHFIRRRNGQQNTVNEFIELATQVGGRVAVPPGRRPDQIDREIKKVTEDMKKRQQEIGGSRQELTLAYQEARKEYTEARRQMETMADVAKTLKDSLSTRHYRWKMFRKYISYRARFTFSYLLSERQFRGRVLMNHAAKELDINVEPDLSKVSDAGRQTKTLSGGEKSFSTICLLLSIWEAMGSPIRCLDEFDVFMDSVNRATSMNMMVQAARRSVGRQFILITPQSMNSVQMQDDVKVHKMSDPERGQTTLPY